MATVRPSRGAEGESPRTAIRFFWVWLAAATSASVMGNVAHAMLNAPNGNDTMAAAAAVVPPAVLLGSTHSVTLLVRARRAGPSYWSALTMTLALAGCAFVLSFDALTDLASTLGMPESRAWLWPCTIDLSIAQSTLALLSLAAPASSRRRRSDPGAPRAADRSPESKQPSDADGRTTANQPMAAGSIGRWSPTARELVRSGVTQKDPAVVAQILAAYEAGTPPTTIGRRLDVHHTTVSRIVARANELDG